MGQQKTKTFNARIADNTTDTQIFKSPWRIRRRYIPVKMTLTNEAASASLIKFFDQDLSDLSNTAPARGDHTLAPLLEVYVPPTTTVYLTQNELCNEFYQGGMVGYATQTDVSVHVEVLED